MGASTPVTTVLGRDRGGEQRRPCEHGAKAMAARGLRHWKAPEDPFPGSSGEHSPGAPGLETPGLGGGEGTGLCGLEPPFLAICLSGHRPWTVSSLPAIVACDSPPPSTLLPPGPSGWPPSPHRGQASPRGVRCCPAGQPDNVGLERQPLTCLPSTSPSLPGVFCRPRGPGRHPLSTQAAHAP